MYWQFEVPKFGGIVSCDKDTSTRKGIKDKSVGLVDTNKVKNVSKTEYLLKKLVHLFKINRLRFPLSEMIVSGNGYNGIELYCLIHIEQSG